MSIVYLARSDYFKNKRVAGVLRFFGILPAFRMEEGIGNLRKNQGVFERCVEILNDNKALGVMPEGNQGFSRKVRPLMKGTFRIAFSAQQKYGMAPGVKIVPIGIHFENFDKFGEHIIINAGMPIEVSEYMEEFQEKPAVAINKIRKRLHDDLTRLTLNLNTDKHYECFETASEIAGRRGAGKQKRSGKILADFVSRQKAAERLMSIEQKQPEIIEKLENICFVYKENLRKLKLDVRVLDKENYNSMELFAQILLLLVTFPVFFAGFILNMIPFFLPDFILKKLRLSFPGGLASLRFGIGIITFPLFYLLQGLFICKKLKDDWWHMLILMPIQYFLGKLAFSWYKSYKKLLVRIRYKWLKTGKSGLLNETAELQDEIFDLMHTC